MATCFAVVYRNRLQLKYRCRHFLTGGEATGFADNKRSDGYEVAIDPNQPLDAYVDGEFAWL